MKSAMIVLVSGLLLTKPSAPPDAAIDEFKLVKNDGTIALYERWIEKDDEKVREIKAIFEVKTDAPSVTSLFKNEAKGLQWNKKADQYKVVVDASGVKWINYIRYNIPWPMDDQDCCLLYQLRPAEGNTSEIVFQSVNNNLFPVSKNISRITGTHGKWVLEKQPGDKMKITYLVSTDRKKNIPRWISDPVVHENLFKTMSSFKLLLENEKK